MRTTNVNVILKYKRKHTMQNIENYFYKLEQVSRKYTSIDFNSKELTLGSYAYVNEFANIPGYEDNPVGMTAVIIEIDNNDYGLAYLEPSTRSFIIQKSWWYPREMLHKCNSLTEARINNKIPIALDDEF